MPTNEHQTFYRNQTHLISHHQETQQYSVILEHSFSINTNCHSKMYNQSKSLKSNYSGRPWVQHSPTKNGIRLSLYDLYYSFPKQFHVTKSAENLSATQHPVTERSPQCSKSGSCCLQICTINGFILASFNVCTTYNTHICIQDKTGSEGHGVVRTQMLHMISSQEAFYGSIAVHL